MQPVYERTYGTFDLGNGPMEPDAFIMRTGRIDTRAYTDPERFERERDVFRQAWLRIGQIAEIPNPGDWFARAIEVCGVSVIVVRGKDHKIRAFHNICSHRGTKLVWDDKGCGQQFLCPYHAWAFNLDGSLRNIPHRDAFPHVNPEESGLKPIAVDQFGGFIFVHLDPAPRQTLRQFLGRIGELLVDAPMDAFKFSVRLTGTVKSNWKLGLEAGSEGYHVFALHEKSAKHMTCAKDFMFGETIAESFHGAHRQFSVPRNVDYVPPANRPVQNLAFSTLPSMVLDPEKAARSAFDLPNINRLKSDKWGVDLVSIFPNFQINLALNGFWIMQYWPLTVDSFRWEAEYFYSQAPATRAEEFAVATSIAFYRDISAEDTASCEKQQIAMTSGALPFIQMGETEMMCRHEMAVIDAVLDHNAKKRTRAIAAE